ncbi:MAG: TadE/TadG family type IV pilus assembly protein [Pseudomonadota bacterium]|nr:TadE/TadG family type IV pilus assembly protein [Pseudomonadota bacterium]
MRKHRLGIRGKARVGLRFTGVRRRFIGDRRGASAVEFAIVAPVFLMLMFSTFEVGWFYFVESTVDGAATNAARMLRTGQVQQADLSSGEFFHSIVCPKIEVVADCPSRLTVEVKNYATFAALAADNSSPFICRDEDTTAINAIPYEPGGDRAIIRVRLCLIYDTLNPAIGLNLAQNDLGQRKITATYVLRAEPYAKSSTSAEETGA